MTSATAFIDLPPVSDEDVAWACRALGLGEAAFAGADGTDPRLEILRTHDTLDIEACPGSGKTTLLVAKLAILARRWPYRTRGLCVLSHTNVARTEIQRRLGGTAEGRRLLSYPHFVGTIHGFVNEFLALPWLRSRGTALKAIDNQLCEQHRRRLLRLAQFSSLAAHVRSVESASGANVVSRWRLSSPRFDVVKSNGEPCYKNPEARAAKQIRALCMACHRDGYHRHDEMFMWADELIDKQPRVIDALRTRFPLLFVDEVQDTSEEQARLLHRLFVDGEQPVRRQRFGDSNQAIYDHADECRVAETDAFPTQSSKVVIPSSHRFGQAIASLADPLAVAPNGLVGCGPSRKITSESTSSKNAILLFDEADVTHVLVAYAKYLQEVFSFHDLQAGTFVAVGAVHRSAADDRVPRSVAHYWPDYDHTIAGAEPRPDTFCGYVVAGRTLAAHGEMYPVLDKIAQAVLRLVRISYPEAVIQNRRRPHRQVLQLLADKPDGCGAYQRLVASFGIGATSPTMEEWEREWRPVVSTVAKMICGACPDNDATRAFLVWQPLGEVHPGQTGLRRYNEFRYPVDEPKVRIRLGSIHSVKGETHTSTLILDTYYRVHHLKTLKPWLLGERSGGGSEGVQNQSRLRQHYVAMTRPTHLLCLALRVDAVNEGEISTLKGRGWRVGQINHGGTRWL